MELHDLPHILPHVERGSTRLVIHVYLQGYVRDRDATQPDAVSHHRVPRLRHRTRVHTRVWIPLLLSGDVRFIWRKLRHVLRSQNHHQ